MINTSVKIVKDGNHFHKVVYSFGVFLSMICPIPNDIVMKKKIVKMCLNGIVMLPGSFQILVSKRMAHNGSIPTI